MSIFCWGLVDLMRGSTWLPLRACSFGGVSCLPHASTDFGHTTVYHNSLVQYGTYWTTSCLEQDVGVGFGKESMCTLLHTTAYSSLPENIQYTNRSRTLRLWHAAVVGETLGSLLSEQRRQNGVTWLKEIRLHNGLRSESKHHWLCC